MTLPLASYANVLGANDQIRIGIIGIGSNVKIGGKGKDEIRKRIQGMTGLEESFERFDNHLYANRIDLKKIPVKLGPMLTFNPSVESFTGDFAEEANKLVRPDYRQPFVIPDKV